MEAMGVLAVEMEAAGLYGVAAERGARALTIATVSDHVRTGESTTSEERQQTFDEMVEIALDALINDGSG
jgi:purine-nucleoside phosphorylase